MQTQKQEKSIIQGLNGSYYSDRIAKITQVKTEFKAQLGDSYDDIRWDYIDLLYNISVNSVEDIRNLFIERLNSDYRTRKELLDATAKTMKIDLSGFYEANLDASEYFKLTAIDGKLKIVERGSIKEKILNLMSNNLSIESALSPNKNLKPSVKIAPILSHQLKKIIRVAKSIQNYSIGQCQIPF